MLNWRFLSPHLLGWMSAVFYHVDLQIYGCYMLYAGFERSVHSFSIDLQAECAHGHCCYPATSHCLLLLLAARTRLPRVTMHNLYTGPGPFVSVISWRRCNNRDMGGCVKASFSGKYVYWLCCHLCPKKLGLGSSIVVGPHWPALSSFGLQPS